MENLAFQAFLFGLLSAASLPLGAVFALFWKPKQKVVAALMAFGGGALLAALTIDLVGDALEKGEFYPLAFGCIMGGLLFDELNQAVNKKGGFLRKMATTITHLKQEKMKQFTLIFRKMSRIPMFHHLPPEEVHAVLHCVTARTYKKGQTIFRQDEPGDSLCIIESGTVKIVDEKNDNKIIATLTANDILGEMSLVINQNRTFSAIVSHDTKVWVIFKEHFDRLLQTCPELAAAVKKLVSTRVNDLMDKKSIEPERAEKWVKKAVKYIDTKVVMPTEVEISEAVSTHGGAPLAIWLGILLDGIPESLVIGSSILHASISFSLIAGLFLSNFPEALSSSTGMRQQQYSFKKILFMWTSIMIITGVGAYAGNIFFVGAPPMLFAIVNGMAAGAMLTMIAETMLPEAFYKGGSIIGFCTLCGFLAAIFFKTLE